MQTELLIFVIAKALLELTGLFLFGQGVLYLMAGQKREQNWFYQLFRVLTGPVVKFARLVTPKMIVDRHVPYVAFLLVVWAWLILVFWALPEMCSSGAVDCAPLLQRKSQG
jgi:hypothetical protein